MLRLDPVFARRLRPGAATPLAVAVSGGGDSVALLALTAAWAREVGRPLRVLTVDHGLQAGSASACAFVAELAARFGAHSRTLHWLGPKPATGVPAVARAARHALLAEAAREVGASVVLMGHTADDVAEGELMRAEGSTLGRLREWAPSPAWPEGRGVYLLRPLLDARRAELRAWLTGEGLPWLEDPSNADLRYARPRARRFLSSPAWDASDEAHEGLAERGVPEVRIHTDGAHGTVQVGRRPGPAPEVLAMAVTCAAGRFAPLRRATVERLAERLGGPDPFTATLGGARVDASPEYVSVTRDAGETARGGLAPLALVPGCEGVWDGRWALRTEAPGLHVVPLRGRAAALPPAERQALRAVPAAVRPTLPLVVGEGVLTSPVLAPGPAAARCLVADRLAAALGHVVREP
jgi:tRNA(Ile)-lysidine synthase